MRRDFNTLIEIIQTQLESIRNAVQEHSRAVRNASESTNQKLSEIPVRLADLAVTDKEKAEERSYRTQSLIQQWVLTVGTWLAFVAAAIYAGVAAHQSRIMNCTLNQITLQTKTAQGAVKAAQDANRDAEERFRKDERPYVAETPKSTEPPHFLTTKPNVTGQIAWNFHYSNFGKTPAYHLHSEQFIKLGDGPFVRSNGEPKHRGETILPPTGDNFITAVSAPIAPEELDQLLKVSGGIQIKIILSYTDSYGTRYETGICETRLNTGTISYCEGNYIK